MKKKLLALSMVAIMAMGLSVGCSKGNKEAEQPKENVQGEEQKAEDGEEAKGIGYEKVVVGLDDGFAPMGFRDSKNEIVGFDVELAKEVSAILGFEVTFQPINWEMKEKELDNKNIDLIWNGYSINDERKDKVLFSNPYLDNRQVVIVLKESGIEKLADLKDKVVTTQAGSSSEQAVLNKPEVKDTFKELVTFDTYEECLRDMAAERSSAVVADEVLIRYYLANHPELEVRLLEEDFGDEKYAVGARKDDTALVEGINTALSTLKDNGKGKEISEKWFGEDIFK